MDFRAGESGRSSHPLQAVPERDWRLFLEVESGGRSKRTDIYVRKQRNGGRRAAPRAGLGVPVERDAGQWWIDAEIEQDERRRGVMFVLLEKNTNAFLVAFFVKAWIATVTGGPKKRHILIG